MGDAIVANHPNGSDGAGVALLVFVDAGLAEPEVSAAVHVAGGGWLLEGDLVWRGWPSIPSLPLMSRTV